MPVYKFFCFDGDPYIVQVIQNDKQPNEVIDYLDMQWSQIDLRQNYPNSTRVLDKPEQFEEMKNLTRKLASDKAGFLRVDLYFIDRKPYFSEYTFYSDGAAAFNPIEWDMKLGNKVHLAEEE